jgi:hypothetical protein
LAERGFADHDGEADLIDDPCTHARP